MEGEGRQSTRGLAVKGRSGHGPGVKHSEEHITFQARGMCGGGTG